LHRSSLGIVLRTSSQQGRNDYKNNNDDNDDRLTKTARLRAAASARRRFLLGANVTMAAAINHTRLRPKIAQETALSAVLALTRIVFRLREAGWPAKCQ